MTSSNGNIFRVTGLLCGEFSGLWWILRTKPVTRSFGVFFDLHLNKQLSKQWWGWWFETPSSSLWRQCNAFVSSYLISLGIPIIDIKWLSLECIYSERRYVETGPWVSSAMILCNDNSRPCYAIIIFMFVLSPWQFMSMAWCCKAGMSSAFIGIRHTIVFINSKL